MYVLNIRAQFILHRPIATDIACYAGVEIVEASGIGGDFVILDFLFPVRSCFRSLLFFRILFYKIGVRYFLGYRRFLYFFLWFRFRLRLRNRLRFRFRLGFRLRFREFERLYGIELRLYYLFGVGFFWGFRCVGRSFWNGLDYFKYDGRLLLSSEKFCDKSKYKQGKRTTNV